MYIRVCLNFVFGRKNGIILDEKKANFAVECGPFDEKFNEFVAKIQHFLAKG